MIGVISLHQKFNAPNHNIDKLTEYMVNSKTTKTRFLHFAQFFPMSQILVELGAFSIDGVRIINAQWETMCRFHQYFSCLVKSRLKLGGLNKN